MIGVLIVDDHPIFRDGLRAALRADDVTVVGEAANADEAVAACARVQPDVVVMDLQMPGGGIAATERILARHPGVHVLVLTMSGDRAAVTAAVRAGAHGYLVKGAGRDELLRAIRGVARGEAVFGEDVARAVLDSVGRSTVETFPQLTAREREVLALIGEGLTNAAIARRLVVSPKTARNHVSNVLAKLGAPTREAAAAMVATRTPLREP